MRASLVLLVLCDAGLVLAVPGDVNADERLDIADPIALLYYLLLGGDLKAPTPFCRDLEPFVLVDNGDGTLSDLNSNLMWQKSPHSSFRSWEESIAHCEELELAGYSDWRLPNVRELASIAEGKWHLGPDCPPESLSPPLEGPTGGYTSSTPAALTEEECSSYQGSGLCYWAMSFPRGWGTILRGSEPVRAVRGGLSKSVGDTNGDTRVDIGDPIYLLQNLFRGGPRPDGPSRLLATGVTQSLVRGDDGYYQAGLPLSYQDNGDETVTDLNTGFIWLKRPSLDRFTSSEMIEAFGRYHIPCYWELLSLVDYGRAKPAIAPGFDLGELDPEWGFHLWSFWTASIECYSGFVRICFDRGWPFREPSFLTGRVFKVVRRRFE